MKKKTIIFDFDGTIADTFRTIIKITNERAPKFGLERLEQIEIKNLRNEKIQDIFKKLGIPFLKLPFFIRKLRQELSQEIEKSESLRAEARSIFFSRKNSFLLWFENQSFARK